MRRVPVLLLACALIVASAGCGGGEGASSGATVSVYVDAGLCTGASRQLAREGGRAGSVRVRIRCLAEERQGGELDLATVGSNARRATEDSTTVAYIESPDRASARFAQPILESAGIASTRDSNGAAAMADVLAAITAANPSSSLRDQVRDSLEAR